MFVHYFALCSQGKRNVQLPSVDNLSDQSELSASPEVQESEFTHPLMHTTTVTASTPGTNRKPGRDMTTPPRTVPRGTGLRAPSTKSALSVRRSIRLATNKRDLQVKLCSQVFL